MSWFTWLSAQVSPGFSLFNWEIHFYGIIIALGLWLGLWLSKRRMGAYGISGDQLDGLFMWGFVGGLIGARLYHVVDYWSFYSQHWLLIPAVWHGGLGIFGGIVGVVLALAIGCWWQKISFMRVVDLVAPGALLAQGIGRWGNFFNQEGFGPPTELPWKIHIDEAYRPALYRQSEFFHPVFLYESLLNLVGAGILFWLARKFGPQSPTFGWYLVLYGVNRFVVEFWRIDTARTDGIQWGHVLAVVWVLVGLGLVLRRHLSVALIKSA